MSELVKAHKTVFEVQQKILKINWMDKSLRSNEVNIALEKVEKSIDELLEALELYL